MPQSRICGSHVHLLLLICLAPLVKAYTIFETTCSAPQPPTEFLFVSSPDTRGTLSILWSSLFTLFACTWTLQHPNVPEQRNDRDPGTLGDIKWKLKAFGSSAKMMIIAALAPEWIIWMAIQDLINADQTQELMEDYAFEDQVPWSLRHSYFANMKGFAIRSIKTSKASENPLRGGKLHRLSKHELYNLRRYRVIKPLPDIRAEEIKDKSKSDTLGKLIAMGQVAWTVVQIIVRVAKRLPVSPLEIAVAAFAVCAPQRVSTPIAIHVYEGGEETLDTILASLYMERDEKNRTEEAEQEALATQVGMSRAAHVDVAALDAERKQAFENSGQAARRPMRHRFLTYVGAKSMLGVSAAIFGGVHAMAWNFAFPTTVELLWWRCAVVYSAAFPLGYVILDRMNKSYLIPGIDLPETQIAYTHKGTADKRRY
ncbi:hypothetical protein HDV64DRAFT_287760 [Trichoderma sp. TUCIM 5745]